MRGIFRRAGMLGLCALALQTGVCRAQEEPAEAMLLYRIEWLDKDRWKPVKDDRKFKRNDTIRFRFTCRTGGVLYVLNTSQENSSLYPVFDIERGQGLRQYLGAGTYIGAQQVGLFPAPEKGGGLRFTGSKDRERFLFLFVPDEPRMQRDMMGVMPGAEGWHFDDDRTYAVAGRDGKILVHYFELKSK